MKDVLSLTTFAIGALCFVVFVTTVKPDAISAVPASSKPEYCKMQASGVSIGVGSRRRSASQAIDLPSDGGGNLGRLFTPGNLLPQIRVVPSVAAAIP